MLDADSYLYFGMGEQAEGVLKMKIGEQTLSDGKVVEIHQCELCWGIHVAEKLERGLPVVVPCPNVPKGEIRTVTYREGGFYEIS